jgi:GDP-4-dehydro-6-deoxy-D-mannose reductase
MRALITGINGFVGGHLAEYLLTMPGWEVWGVSRAAQLALPQIRNQVRLVHADLCNAVQTEAAIATARPDVIFHLAGQPFVPESFRDPAATLNTNILAQLHILLALIAQDCHARVLAVCTNEEYGTITPADLPIDEDTPLRPANPYGVSKIAQDMLALQYSTSHGLDIVRVRPFTHIGPRQSERFVAAAFARQIAQIEAGNQPPVMQVGNLSAQRDFTDVRDIVRAYVLAVEHGESGQVYNIGVGQAVTIQSLLEQLLAMSTIHVDVQPDPQRMRPIDVPLVVCDPRRFHACTGWQPHIPFKQTLQDILNDWRTRV